MLRSSPTWAAVALALFIPLSAQAADVPAPAPAAASSVEARADDVVRRRDGAEFRGRIAERVPNSHVDIVTLTGQAYRIPWADVTYAGPSAEAASAPPRGAQGQAPLAARTSTASGDSLLLTANRDTLVWVTRAPDGPPCAICRSPCETAVPEGPHLYGLVAPGREAVWDPDERTLSGAESLHGTYYSRRPHRIGGAVFALSGVATSTFLLANATQARRDFCGGGFGSNCEELSAEGKTYLGTAVVIGVVSLVVGAALMTRTDEVVMEPRPRRLVTPGPLSEATARSEPPAPNPERPRYTALQPALWACMPGAEPGEVTLTVEFDAAQTVQRVVVAEGTAAEVERCVQAGLAGQRVEHAPEGPRTLRFKRPAAATPTP